MHFFIYPQGNCGRSIAWIFKYLSSKGFFSHTYSFMDDLMPLEEKNALVLIASYKHQQILIDKLRKRGIFKYQDGIEWAAKLLNEYFHFSTKRIGILLDDYKSQKHFGNIQKELEKRGFEVLRFILSDVFGYEEDNNAIVICQDMLRYLNICALVIGTGFHPQIFSAYMRIFSSYYIPNFHSYYHDRELIALKSYELGLQTIVGGGGIYCV